MNCRNYEQIWFKSIKREGKTIYTPAIEQHLFLLAKVNFD